MIYRILVALIVIALLQAGYSQFGDKGIELLKAVSGFENIPLTFGKKDLQKSK